MADEQKQAFTAEQQEALDKAMGNTVNNMLTARLSTFEKKLHAAIGQTLDEKLGKSLDEKLQAFKPAAETQETGNKGKKDVEIETLRKSMQEMQQMLLESQRVAANEREKNRRESLNKVTLQHLRETGRIEGVAADLALSALIAKGLIGYDDDNENPDKPIFRAQEGAVDLSMGIKSWLKTDEGKFFQPPSGVRGGGSQRPGFAPAGPNGKPSADQAKAMLNDLIERELLG